MKSRCSLDYQVLARPFEVGDLVYVVHTPDSRGRVKAVYPSIGMVDVVFPNGVVRYPVEDLMRLDADAEVNPPPSSVRVAGTYLKKAIYWVERDRKYRATRGEQDSGKYFCPRCKSPLKKMIYKRRNGTNAYLLGCSGPICSFLVKPEDVYGCHHVSIVDNGSISLENWGV